jgi:hypothetical protein
VETTCELSRRPDSAARVPVHPTVSLTADAGRAARIRERLDMNAPGLRRRFTTARPQMRGIRWPTMRVA